MYICIFIYTYDDIWWCRNRPGAGGRTALNAAWRLWVTTALFTFYEVLTCLYGYMYDIHIRYFCSFFSCISCFSICLTYLSYESLGAVPVPYVCSLEGGLALLHAAKHGTVTL